MNKQLYVDIYKQALNWVNEAGDHLRESLNEAYHIEFKTSASDLVTEKDRQTEQFLVDKIKGHFPNHYILGEEGVLDEGDYDPQQEIVWIIDPIDGTTNFVHQKQNFAISVGVFHCGEPVVGVIYDPIAKECFHAQIGKGAYLNEERLEDVPPGEDVAYSVISLNGVWLAPNKLSDHHKLHSLVHDLRGARCIGAASLEIAYIACGRLDGYLTYHLAPWDFAGGYVIMHEVGAPMTKADGMPLNLFEKSSFFAAKPKLHEQILNDYLK